MKCIIIDDESTARAIIQQLCKNVPDLELMADFPSAISAIKYLNEQKVDLVFLDIHMPDFNGFDFIKTLSDPPKIILTTSDKNFALDAFGYDCVIDYLVKPVDPVRFTRACERAISLPATTSSESNASDHEEELYVNIDRRLVKITISDIYLIEANGDYINIKTEEKNHIVHSTLKKIEDKLPDQTFLKVHRSYIINVKKIIDIEDNSVLIKQDIIPVSRANRKELMRRLNLL